MATDGATRFAPSELVLLNGEKFAKKVLMGNVSLLHTDADVSAEQLGRAIFAAALLSAEQAGAIRLEVRPKKALFGLRTVKTLYADPAGSTGEWPANSLEAAIRPLAEHFQADKGSNEVSRIVVALLQEDSASPWQTAIELVKAGLAERGLLETVEEKKLKLFTVRNYILPESTAKLAGLQPAEPVQQLLATTERERPEVWKLLLDHIKAAVSARTEQDDSGDFNSD